MDVPESSTEELWKKSWDLLEKGASEKEHDFNLGVLCSIDSTLHPRSRTLVLRKAIAEEGELWCYTDRRSAKAKAVNAGRDTLSWTFWSPSTNIQFNGTGRARWLDEGESRNIFDALPKHSRKAYATLSSPGTPVEGTVRGLPLDWEKRELVATNYAADNFGVLITHLTSAEVLQLSREGHQRIRASRLPFRTWQLECLVP